MDQANILIIGGGVIGCAIAHAVSQRSGDVFLVEQNPKLGMATSTRNSGVIHSGIYYPRNSLKARLCIEGNRLMYEAGFEGISWVVDAGVNHAAVARAGGHAE